MCSILTSTGKYSFQHWQRVWYVDIGSYPCWLDNKFRNFIDVPLFTCV
jgi:alpha-mannosidase